MRRSESNLRDAKRTATVERVNVGDAALINVVGIVDEHFPGLGDIAAAKVVVINVAGATRMTSFGVRQWLNAMDALPKSGIEIYLLGCPTFFVDQLNMVLNFAGGAKVLTVQAPFACTGCGIESSETIDVLAERGNLAKGVVTDRQCSACDATLELDESPESYFAFVSKYAASSIVPAAAQMLAQRGLYQTVESATERPPRIIKLVHGSVTYFRIIGTIGQLFRARPFLVGAEGEVVIDLSEVDRFESAGVKEWRRLLKSLAGQVPSVTLVDVTDSLLATAGDSLAIARNVIVASLLVPYSCKACGRIHAESANLERFVWPIQFGSKLCPTCGGMAVSTLTVEILAPLQKASTSMPRDTAKVFARRDELLSRALTDAAVAQAGDRATAMPSADDMILGKYKIVKPLSAGGMAEVFVATQVGIGGFEKPVALKRIQRKLLDSRHQAIELFLNEAKIAGRLMHPNIVQVLDVGEVGGALYLAMEYVHGKDLRKFVRKLQATRQSMPLAEALHIVREVALALHHAYWANDLAGKQLSVVHRDVSPHNVIIGYDGTVKLLDFGVAMSAVTEHTETIIVGKWLYMSPEITTNEAVDHRSDLFSLGVVLYLLCTGAMPFAGTEPKQIVRNIRAGRYRPMTELAPVPERLNALVSRMLASNPDHRPQKGQEVADELYEIARENGITSSPTAMAGYIAQMFPEASTTQEIETVGIKEIVRASDEMPAVRDRSPVSVTPSRGSMLPIDVSETFRRSNFNMSMIPHRTSESMTAERTVIDTPREVAVTDVAQAPPAAIVQKPRERSPLRIVLVTLLVLVGALAGYLTMAR